MSHLAEKIAAVRREFEQALASSTTVKELEEVRTHFLGKKGLIPALMQELKDLSVEEKKTVGAQLNELRLAAEQTLETRKETLVAASLQADLLKKQNFDLTAYTPSFEKQGHLHVYTQVIQEIEDIFLSMGYSVLEGPEVETDYYNFTALNIPEDHPARDMYDTLWLDRTDLLLRTHTSPVQIHALETRQVPIAGIVPGRVFRHEAVDASHEVMFMQCEGIFVDKGISLAHLFGTAKTFLSALFQTKDLDIRIRPGFFPFVEPGVEIDMRCPFCKTGCSVCKRSTWIEVFPGGMVHPHVLRGVGIDPDDYSGFAFGFGLSRLAMLKYGIYDIRLFHSGKMQFLKQF